MRAYQWKMNFNPDHNKQATELLFSWKAKKGIGIIKYLSKFLPIKTHDQMYKALVRSHLDCCDTIYHVPASNSQINLGVTLNSLMEKVERTQYQAALVITGTVMPRISAPLV